MIRGEIRAVDFDPARPGETDKRRPAVIVSNDAANTTAARLGRGVITVVPIGTHVERVYPFQVLLHPDESGLQHVSKAQAEQVRAVVISRVGPKIGLVPPPLMLEVDAALRLHLAV